jgi:hypothetical protein
MAGSMVWIETTADVRVKELFFCFVSFCRPLRAATLGTGTREGVRRRFRDWINVNS